VTCPECGGAIGPELYNAARGSATGLTFYTYRCSAGHFVRRINRLRPVA
jgi:hypothetical protein